MKVDNATFLQAQADSHREAAERLEQVARDIPAKHKTITRRLCGEHTYITDNGYTKYFAVMTRKPYHATQHHDDGSTSPTIAYSNDNTEQFDIDGKTPAALVGWLTARAKARRRQAAKLEEFLRTRAATLRAVKQAAEIYAELIDGLPYEARDAYGITYLPQPHISEADTTRGAER